MINKGWMAAMLGAAAMTMSASALAQKQSETGWYVGGSLGQNDDLDDAMAWKISAGYQITRNLAVELGYSSLGEKDVLGVTVEGNAWELIGLYKFPIANQFSIYGLLGFARIEAEAVVPTIGKVSDTSTELTYGLGVQYDFSPKLGVRAQYQDYDGSAVISAGIVYKF
jgi:opacity protein-like surface antigen